MIKRQRLRRALCRISMAAFLLTTSGSTQTLRANPPEPNINVSGFFSSDKAQRGRVILAAVVMDIPGGYHVNSNRPMSKYAIPTTLKIDAPGGVKVSAVTYPRAKVRRLKASNNEPLALFEGRTILRFTLMVPANFQQGVTELKVKLRYQSCSDDVCFAPQTREITMPIGVVGAGDSVKRINANIFGNRR